MVLTGSLLVGDSVKATLKRQAELRVGKADIALVGGDHFFRAKLADDLGGFAAPALLLRGSLARSDGSARVNQAQVLGVDERFWPLAPGASSELPPEEIGLNERAAAQLGVKAGETVIVRVEKPGFFSKDAPLSGEENEVIAIRAKVARVVTDAQFGRFGLQASQVPPFSVFVPLGMLQQRLAFAGRANLLLSSHAPRFRVLSVRKPIELGPFEFALPTLFKSVELPADVLEAEVLPHWKIEDAGLQIRKLPAERGLEVRTPRVFLEPQIVEAAPRGLEALTYLVNEIRAGEKAAPYSMVTALDAPASGFLPAELADDEIVISQWLADDLGVALNGRVTLKYFVMGERRQLTEKSREFEVIQILPMTEPQLDSSWMPDFPGLTDKKNCRDWQPGFQMDTGRIRDQDEAYWQKYRGTPKAFVNLTVGQQMWGNRWGKVTSIRYPPTMLEGALSSELRGKLTPQMIGMSFVPLREQALAATRAPVDFGELFVSFSFFLIVAAAVLTGLLFVFSLEQRNAEAGLLLALGLRPKQVRRLFLAEGAVLALVGGVLGALGALVYTRLVLRALATVWRGAVGAVEFEFGANPVTLPVGVVAGVLTALLAMWLASRRQLRHSARELLTGEIGEAVRPLAAGTGQQKRWGWLGEGRLQGSLTLGAALGAGALIVSGRSPGAFFGAGALLLVAGLSASLGWLRRLAFAPGELDGIAQLGVRNAARRRGRSLATIGVLASGVFMVVAVDSFRKTPPREGDTSDPGTGGFALVGESSLPIYEDLNEAKGREAYGLSEEVMRGVRVVPMRVRDGDDASCLNLNRALQPRLLGVKAAELEGRFRFSGAGQDWSSLSAHSTSNDSSTPAVPGTVDANTLQWALQKNLGDSIEYRDERGAPMRVQLAAALTGSILQGSLVIAEDRFMESFPGSGGYRLFLIDAPAEKAMAVREHLSRQLSDRGLELTSTAQKLGEFQAVENTYLSIFQALGGLGLLLGSAGLAIVVARNVLERRREFGLLEAVGFRPGQLRHLVFAEHRWLIAAALLIGTASALLAVWPNLAEKGRGFPAGEMAVLLASLAAGCLFWTWLATRLALRGSGVAALRSE
jgi:ABC-type lipoprotein release transport system permease subunit